jgi:hypothetical protein
VTDIRWQVAKIARQRTGLTDGHALLHGGFGLGEFVASFDDQGQFAQRPTDLVGLALELIEAIGGSQRGNHCLADAPGDAALADSDFAQEQAGILGAGALKRLDRQADGGTVFLFPEFLFLAQTDQQDAVAQRAGDVMQQQRSARLAVHVTTLEYLADQSAGCVVEQLRRKSQAPIFEYADDDTATTLFLRATAFYAKFHALLLVPRKYRHPVDYPRIFSVSSKHDIRARRTA